MSHDDRNPGVVIKLRRDTTANWATDNPVLAEGETGWDTDLLRVKLGDGVTAWNALPWAADEAASVTAETARAEAAEAALDTRVDSLESTEGTYGDIVTHNASEFTTDAELATEASTRGTADTTLQTNITTEATTRGNADTTLQTNINTETTDRTNADTALDARLDVLEAATAPGKEIGYAERTTSHTTTVTSAASATDITGLSVTVTGKGRPVEVNFYTSSVTHSVANSNVSVFISGNGAVGGSLGQFGGQSSPSTTAGLGDAINVTRRVVLTDGVSYTFTVRVFSLTVGTSTIYGAAGLPMSLAVTAR